MLAAPQSLLFISSPQDSKQQKGESFTPPLLFRQISSVSSTLLDALSSLQVLVAMENPPLARNAVEAVVFGSKNGEGDGGEMAASETELRRVPSGPDPLHHHGSTPRKPDDRNNVPPNP